MRVGGTLIAAAGVVLLAGSAPAQDPLGDARSRLASAKAEAAAATRRAMQLDQRAATERDAADRSRTEEAAVAARIAGSEADIAAAQARVAIVERLLAVQRADLAAKQQPAAQLLAALTALARRPTIAAVAQPGSISDLVHVRAALGSTLPVIRARTANVRAGIARTRALEADAALAAKSLRDSRAALVGERRALVALRRRHEASATEFGRNALAQSDRAIAMGEEARDIVEGMGAIGAGRATLNDLAGLLGPPTGDMAAARGAPAYRLPVTGRLVTGFGEISDNGVRARGLTFVVGAGAAIRAPAGGRIVFARPFRGYRGTVIIDHGDGWSTLVTGLDTVSAVRGATIAAGDPLGRAGRQGEPQITVELRRRDRPVDITALIG